MNSEDIATTNTNSDFSSMRSLSSIDDDAHDN